MIEFYSEANADSVIKEAKEFSKYLATNSFNALPYPFKQSANRITRTVFSDYTSKLQKKLKNDYAAAVVIGEMRGTERIMKYFEETGVFKDHPQKDLLYGDMLMLLNSLTNKVRNEFNFECNIDNDFINYRTEKYAKMDHIPEKQNNDEQPTFLS